MRNILIAEDHPLVQIGIENILHEHMQEIMVFTAEKFSSVLSLIEKHKFDLLILDINIPEGDSVEMIHTLRYKQPKLPILICSSYDEHLYAISFLKAGVNGYISKRAPKEEFKVALEYVLGGKIYVSPVLLQSTLNLLVNSKNMESPVEERLSEKELEISKLLVKGYPTKTVSEILHLSSSSVSSYKARIFKKLKVVNIVELATYLKPDH